MSAKLNEKDLVLVESTKKELTNNEKLYANKLLISFNDLDKELKKRLKKSIVSVCDTIMSTYKKKDYIKIQITDEQRQSLEYDLILALGCPKDTEISNNMLKDAIVSATKNKFIKSDVKNKKVDGYAYSVADFFKSLNASIYGKIVRELTK